MLKVNRILFQLVELFYRRGGNRMRRSNPKYSEYIKRQNRIRERKRSKRNKHHKKNTGSSGVSNQYRPILEASRNDNDARKTYTSKIPAVFSIMNNPDEVVEYFYTLIDFLKKSTDVRRLQFDFSAVTEMTIDALMYLMSVVKFIRKEFCRVDEFAGNIPTSFEAQELFMKSGFSQSMSSTRLKFKPDESVIRICYDESTNTQKTKEICEFVISHSHVERKDTMFLYNMLMELEANADEHAYNSEKTEVFRKKWLAFVEDIGDAFRFTFLDIGAGIYSTIHRKLHEKLSRQPECAYVISAFEGVKLRSETQKSFRGRGLPKIKQFYDTHRIENLRIVTNKTYCCGNHENTPSLTGKLIKRSFIGTLYYWEITKQSLRKGRMQ